MGDYGFGLNSNVRALSPVDFNQLTNNQSLFSPEPVATHAHTMQDETLLSEKSAVKQQQQPQQHSSPNPSENGGDPHLEDSMLRKNKVDGQHVSQEEKKNNNNVNDSVVNSVANSLNQLGLSEPTSTVISSLATTPSFWSTATADDTFIQGFQAINGQVTFQNFPPAPNPMFNTNLAPQLGLNVPQQQPPQRRAITGHHNQYQPQRQHQQSNLFMNNTKTYPTWSSAPAQQQSSWSQQNQQTLNPWGNIQQQRRSVPNLNPIGAPVKKPPSHHQQTNSSMMISPSKFRRSTSFPGQMQQSAIGTKPVLDFPGLDDHRDSSMLGLQVRPGRNSRWLPQSQTS